jgi:hypothetical protein
MADRLIGTASWVKEEAGKLVGSPLAISVRGLVAAAALIAAARKPDLVDASFREEVGPTLPA